MLKLFEATSLHISKEDDLIINHFSIERLDVSAVEKIIF